MEFQKERGKNRVTRSFDSGFECRISTRVDVPLEERGRETRSGLEAGGGAHVIGRSCDRCWGGREADRGPVRTAPVRSLSARLLPRHWNTTAPPLAGRIPQVHCAAIFIFACPLAASCLLLAFVVLLVCLFSSLLPTV